jgi:hypothetical protein
VRAMTRGETSKPKGPGWRRLHRGAVAGWPAAIVTQAMHCVDVIDCTRVPGEGGAHRGRSAGHGNARHRERYARRASIVREN